MILEEGLVMYLPFNSQRNLFKREDSLLMSSSFCCCYLLATGLLYMYYGCSICLAITNNYFFDFFLYNKPSVKMV